MRNKLFEKFADKLLNKAKKGDDLKKYNIDLSGVLGEDIDQKQLQHNENRKLVGLTKTCLMSKLHFWLAKTNKDYSSRVAYIERDIKIAVSICDKINKNNYTNDDIDKLKFILVKHSCI